MFCVALQRTFVACSTDPLCLACKVLFQNYKPSESCLLVADRRVLHDVQWCCPVQRLCSSTAVSCSHDKENTIGTIMTQEICTVSKLIANGSSLVTEYKAVRVHKLLWFVCLFLSYFRRIIGESIQFLLMFSLFWEDGYLHSLFSCSLNSRFTKINPFCGRIFQFTSLLPDDCMQVASGYSPVSIKLQMLGC